MRYIILVIITNRYCLNKEDNRISVLRQRSELYWAHLTCELLLWEKQNCLKNSFVFVPSLVDVCNHIPQFWDHLFFCVPGDWWRLYRLKHGELHVLVYVQCNTEDNWIWEMKQSNNSRLWSKNKPLCWLTVIHLEYLFTHRVCQHHSAGNIYTILPLERVPTCLKLYICNGWQLLFPFCPHEFAVVKALCGKKKTFSLVVKTKWVKKVVQCWGIRPDLWTPTVTDRRQRRFPEHDGCCCDKEWAAPLKEHSG